jgi:hypothetical protein
MAETTDPRVFQLQLEHLAGEVEKMRATSLAQIARAKKTNIEAAEIAAGGTAKAA